MLSVPLLFHDTSLLRRLLVHKSVGGKGQSSTEENDGVQTDARRGTVGGSGRSARLRVRLGLWVAFLHASVSANVFFRFSCCFAVKCSRGVCIYGTVPT